MLNKIKYACYALIALGLMAQSANAALITMTPSSQTIELGDTASIDVSISDFATDQYLGVYDFEVAFNDSILSVSNIIFGTELGFSFQNDSSFGADLHVVLEASLEDAQYLIDNQASEFLLFTIEFTGTNYGSSSVALDYVLLGDQDGNEITDVDFNSARITVNNPNAVPEPSALGILFAGFAFIAMRKRANYKVR
ncbi:PEP-CTERM sorting domain-containing protein [Paraglaciecola mesophila]|uniref:PEP-CTERM sorting domain-containing protein n=1 Tax=Paraglaciecola mesophila TaxID=197222 RepID=A0ABU9SSP9_9ALTE